jgi:hypothetical protein
MADDDQKPEDGPVYEIEIPDVSEAGIAAAESINAQMKLIGDAIGEAAANVQHSAMLPRFTLVTRQASKSEAVTSPAAIASAEAIEPVGASTSPAAVTTESSPDSQPVESPAVFDFTTEAGRNNAVASYTRHWCCSQGALARTANVNRSDLTHWKQGTLKPATSTKKTAIENALRNNTPPTLTAKQLARQQS